VTPSTGCPAAARNRPSLPTNTASGSPPSPSNQRVAFPERSSYWRSQSGPEMRSCREEQAEFANQYGIRYSPVQSESRIPKAWLSLEESEQPRIVKYYGTVVVKKLSRHLFLFRNCHA
jgi:hypothetical protein